MKYTVRYTRKDGQYRDEPVANRADAAEMMAGTLQMVCALNSNLVIDKSNSHMDESSGDCKVVLNEGGVFACSIEAFPQKS